MKLIKLTDLEIGIIYINSDRIISVESNLWVEEDNCIQEGSIVGFWNGERILSLSVTERAEKIQEMVNK